jgi:putative membrane-bound dehydrogenase-like protein
MTLPRFVSVVLILFTLTALPAGAQSTYSVGVAAVDITPTYPVRLSGFGFRRTESEGVTQQIWAKALAVGNDEPAVLIAVDNLGVPAGVVEEVATRLRKACVQRERLAVTSTHTHTAPMLTNACPTLFGVPIPKEHQEHIDRYTRELTNHLEKVALDALKDRARAELYWETGKVKFAKNRRTKGGPVDHDLAMLVVKEPKGKVRAVYVSYACHCVTLSNNKISGDWAGFAANAIQRAHPGAIALVSVGCGADQNPTSDVTFDKVDVAAGQGAEIARETDRLLGGLLKPITGKLFTQVKSFDLAFDTLPTRAQWEEKAKRKDAVGYHAKVQLAKLDRGEKLAEKLPYSVQTWTFGDSLAMVFLPGEVVVDYGLRLKRELDPARLWVNAYSNDAPCYIPSERVLKEGGYEGGDAMIYYDRPTRFKAGLEEPIIKAVHEQLDKTFKPPFDPKKTQGTRPLSPRQSQAAIKLKDGFVAELVACEPLVQSPVAVNWGPDGRLWVAEMADYPSGIDGQFKPGGRIKVLESTKGDGIYDKATIFLDNIPFPTGVTPWRKGVLVCAAPDILYAEDTKGTGKADVVKKLFSGWATHNYQARVNGLEYGLDGWVYGCGGLFGGDITSFSNPKPVPLAHRDFRLNPDTGVIEAAAGRSQHGRVRNDWGDWFGCDNSTFLRHYPLADHYLRRNPQMAVPNNDVIVTDYPDWNRCYPLNDGIQLFKLSGPPGRATAACGVGIYRDVLLGKEYTGNAFTCEPVNLLVHRLVLTPKGSTFSARRAPDEQQSEFLASSDGWFRPVQARTGPDGALYIVDMYRFVIEHPRWIPPEELAKVDVRAGYNMGRIYRIYHKDRPPRPIKRLDKLDTAGLVAALDSPNGPQRDLAMEMLVWKQDKEAVKHLQRLMLEKKPVVRSKMDVIFFVKPLLRSMVNSERSETRLQVLCTLDGMKALDNTVLYKALTDRNPGVVRHAIRLAPKLTDNHPVFGQWFNSMRKVKDAKLQLELAYGLGQIDLRVGSGSFLAQLAKQNADDPYFSAAVLSSLNKNNLQDFTIELVREGGNKHAHHLLGPVLSLALAFEARAPIDVVLHALKQRKEGMLAPWQIEVIAIAVEAIEHRKSAIDKTLDTERVKSIKNLEMGARAIAEDAKQDDSLRVAAAGVLGRLPSSRKEDLGALRKLLVQSNSLPLQAAAVGGLARIGNDEAVSAMFAGWKGHSPALRGSIIDEILAREASLPSLMDALEKGPIQPVDFDAARRQRLLQHKDAAIRSRAAKLFTGIVNPSREKVLVEYQAVATTKGDQARGKDVFTKRCSTCHKLDGVGHDVGPDLRQMANKSPAAFLIAILDPNQAVDARYIQYLAVTKDGRQHNGILASETATSITLREQEGKEKVILRTDLEALESTGKSLMPEGLEKDINKQEMADLIAYLTANAQQAKQVEGNRPAVIKPAADGTLKLSATNGAIHGGDITFEPAFRNIGNWHGEKDHVLWTVELDKPTSYDVYLEWACADNSAGNVLILEVAGKTLRHRVAGTGADWSNYKIVKIGTITVRDGKQQITVRAEGKPQGALCDLRSLIFVKEGGTEPKAEGAK